MKIAVTGASGFIGSALCRTLVSRDFSVRAVSRRPAAGHPAPALSTSAAGQIEFFPISDAGPGIDWRPALQGADAVVHLIARTHETNKAARGSLHEYRQLNVQATRQLADAAVNAGVHRLIFMSSVKVHGEATGARPFTEADTPLPQDAYGISKWEAEQALKEVRAKTGLEVITLRPPLVYGPGVKGNFLRLMNWVARGWPLPLASINNRRSLIYVGNLVDAIVKAIDAPQAAGKIYLVSDGEDVSTPELVRRIAAALGVQPRLLPCPVALLRLGAAALGRAGDVARLLGSLQIDSSKIRRELGWRPRYTLEQGLAETARWFKNR